MKVTFFNLSIKNAIYRFYLMMAVVILAGFTGIWAVAILALPIFLSIMAGMGISFETKAVKPVSALSRRKSSGLEKAA